LAKAADDFKVTTGKYMIQIGQCGGCMKRQKQMNPEIFMEKVGRERKIYLFFGNSEFSIF
jgi:hypothetical protein